MGTKDVIVLGKELQGGGGWRVDQKVKMKRSQIESRQFWTRLCFCPVPEICYVLMKSNDP